MRPEISAVVPMFNEAENAATTLAALARAFDAEGWSYELIPVDDGSTDATPDILSSLAREHRTIHPQGYRRNRGRGFALRRGFAAARGRYVVSLDADLSYSTETIVRMLKVLMSDHDVDIVLASQWMPGGRLEGVPAHRAFISWAGNVLLRQTLPQKVYTSTSICRAYRKEVLDSLDLSSEGKEIHLEILSEAMALGYNICEVPATLGVRKKGTSKFRPRATIISHLLFAVLERPATVFAAAGILIIAAAIPLALFLLSLSLTGRLNPERPLMTVMVILFLGGLSALGFALVSLQMLELRRGLIRLRSDMAQMRSANRHALFDAFEEISIEPPVGLSGASSPRELWCEPLTSAVPMTRRGLADQACSASAAAPSCRGSRTAQPTSVGARR